MLSSVLLSLAAAKVISASPLKTAPIISANDSNVIDLTPYVNDMVVLLTDGTQRVLNHSSWEDELKWAGVKLEVPQLPEGFLDFVHPGEPEVPPIGLSKRELEKRQNCKNTQVIIQDKEDTFVDWDVQMSNVACANAGPIDIFVMSGWTVTNEVSVSSGLDPTIIKDWLGGKVGVDFGKSWSTTQSVQNKGTVSPGNCGCMITQPLTTRRSGRVMRGCPGSYEQVATWSADDHGKGSYNGVEWISGSVSMCAKKGSGPPLSRCSGQGNFK